MGIAVPEVAVPKVQVAAAFQTVGQRQYSLVVLLLRGGFYQGNSLI